MPAGGQRFAVVLRGVRLVARLLVGLTQQRQNQRIALVRFLQIRDGGLVVAGIKRYVAGQIRIKAGLVGIVRFVESNFGGGYVLAGFVGFAAAGGDAGLRVLPAEQPQIFVRVGKVGLA